MTLPRELPDLLLERLYWCSKGILSSPFCNSMKFLHPLKTNSNLRHFRFTYKRISHKKDRKLSKSPDFGFPMSEIRQSRQKHRAFNNKNALALCWNPDFRHLLHSIRKVLIPCPRCLMSFKKLEFYFIFKAFRGVFREILSGRLHHFYGLHLQMSNTTRVSSPAKIQKFLMDWYGTCL